VIVVLSYVVLVAAVVRGRAQQARTSTTSTRSSPRPSPRCAPPTLPSPNHQSHPRSSHACAACDV
jgi:hypothetical protein